MMRKLLILVLCIGGLAATGASAAGAAGFWYEKQGDPIGGHIRGECGYQCVTSWYRAGSGNGGMDGCQWGNWTPNGTYDMWGHYDNYDATIKGRVWYLSDHYCSSNGVWRTELFVHSEETADNGQLCGDPYYNEDYCWDGEGDYYSLGCIKVRRRPIDGDGTSHLGKLDNFHHTYYVSQVLVTS